MIDVAIVTPLPEEWHETVRKIEEAQEVPSNYPAAIGVVGHFRVLVCMPSHTGNPASAAFVTDMAREWHPRWIVLLGIAGGFPEKGVHQGDVVFATQVFGYEYGKVAEGKFKRRSDYDFPVDEAWLGHAKALAAQVEGPEQGWRRLSVPPAPGPSDRIVHFQPIASGEKVDDDPEYEFFAQAFEQLTDVGAVEMEAVGTGSAVRQLQSSMHVGLLVVRGISDCPTGTTTNHLQTGGTAQRDGWKRHAAASAAAFAVELLSLPGAPVAREKIPDTQTLPFQAPPDVIDFVNRESDLASMRLAISSGLSGTLTNVTGMPGVGKTAMAIHFAHLHRTLFGGVLWAFAGEQNVQEILYAFAEAYGQGRALAELSNHSHRISFLQRLLNERRPLVIVDDVRRKRDLDVLLRAVGSCPTIVTSRKRSVGETATQAIDTHPLSPEDSANLLSSTMGRELRPEESEPAKEIVRLVGGLPLALRILGRRAKWSNYSMPQLLARLEAERIRAIAWTDDNTKDTNVRVSFDVSYVELDAVLANAFDSLGTFRGPDFSSDAVAHINRIAVSDAEDLLAALYELSLIEPSTAERWRLHPLLREYAAEHQMANGKGKENDERAIDFFCELTALADSEIHGADQDIWFDRLDSEYQNIRGAYERAEGLGDLASQRKIASCLGWYWSVRGYQSEGRDWLSSTIAHQPPDAVDIDFARALLGFGYLAANQGDFDVAHDAADKSVTICSKIRDPEVLAMALHRRGYASWGLGNYGSATADARRARNLCKRHMKASAGTEYKRWCTRFADSCNLLGLIRAYKGEQSAAVRAYNTSLRHRVSVGDTWGISATLNNLGEVRRCQRRMNEAEELYLQSLSMRVATLDAWGTANSLNNLGELQRARGDLEGAYHYFLQGLEVARRLNNRVAIATSAAGIAGIAALREEWRLAATIFGFASKQLTASRARLGPANHYDYDDFVSRALGAKATSGLRGQFRAGSTLSVSGIVPLLQQLQPKGQ